MKNAITILDLARSQGVVRTRDLEKIGMHRNGLAALVRTGQLQKLSRGLYALPGRESTEHASLAEVAIKYPRAVFCLLTALQIHGITTQSPHQVWIAIDTRARTPSLAYPPLRVLRFSGDALTEGIVQVTIDGVVQIPVTSVAKTIADCFKYRHKIGLDVALEALREAWSDKKVSMDELMEAARICRVANVMRPYLESIV